MDTPRDDRLAEDLRALRPTPRPAFAAKLDERAAAGFPRRSRLPLAWMERLRAIEPRRLLVPAGATAILAIAVATALIGVGERSGTESLIARDGGSELHFDGGAKSPDGGGKQGHGTAQPAVPSHGESNSGIQYETAVPTDSGAASAEGQAGNFDGSGRYLRGSTRLSKRAVERSAELTLAASPAEVGDDSAAVFEAVHAHKGIVMRSSTREGNPGEAAARFELLIPSARLSDALAALSAIDEVRSRHEATNDITAPTVTTGELLRDSKARIDSLLAQLAAAGSESERATVEAELAQERRHRSRLRAQLQRLERRADYSRVLVRIETGDADESSGGGAWGVGDALDDAGKILAVAAAVAVVALAVLGPIALIALLAWLTHRAWVRRERRRVLG